MAAQQDKAAVVVVRCKNEIHKNSGILKSPACRISIIVPVLNEGQLIQGLLKDLQPLRNAGHELILVDGGSTDDTCNGVMDQVDQLLTSAAGRANQMNEGANAATADILWFIHADTQLPVNAHEKICQALGSSNGCWGRFDVEIASQQPLLKLVAWMMNGRSRLTGIATGDQGIFIRRKAFFAIGGFPKIPLMEDIAISSRLKTLSPPCCLKTRIKTSARRWEQNGVIRTILLMWQLRLAYWLGSDPHRLAKRYRKCNSPTPES